MIRNSILPKQPSLIVSYWNVGSLLYSSVILFVLESFFYWMKLKAAYTQESLYIVIFWLWSLLFSFSHIFLVLMDGWSRFQNYKRIKDHLFVHGFTPKMARHYIGSKCQRTAVLVAARELGLEEDVERYYRKLGIKWFHFIPHFMVRDPLFFFKKYFWSRTFMEKHYTPKFNFRELEQKMSL